MSTIAYQGIPGSYSHTAAKRYFTRDNKFKGTKQFKEIFQLINNHQADYGVIPVENSLAGSVYENYDLLAGFNHQIVGENYLKIEHCLLALEKDLEKIKKVYSHPKALEQCLKFFEQNPNLSKEVFSDTASAAKFIADNKNLESAAIASISTAQLYNLNVIKKNIEDNEDNYTRFLIICKNKQEVENADKCSIIFKLPHIPGSLYKTLKYFADANLNLTKIESRPIHGKIFEYLFYVDLEFENNKLKNVKNILNDLKNKVVDLIILGLYQSSHEQIKS